MSMHPARNLFAEFKGNSRVFVETGSYRGDGIQLALDAEYEKIISIDIDPAATEFCKHRFDLYRNPNPAIELITGDSAECLLDVIKDIGEPTLFWLDSHWQMLEGTEPGPNPFPLTNELIAIHQHRDIAHAIIIDDLLYMTHPEVTGFKLAGIKRLLRSINPNFVIRLMPNPVINNILVAHL